MSQQPIPGTRPALAEHGAGRSEVPYLALHPMGFSVPPRLRLERWALTPPFHPYPALAKTVINPPGQGAGLGFRKSGAVYSLWHYPSGCLVAPPPACILRIAAGTATRGYAASYPTVFGLSSPSSRWKRFSALPKSFEIYTECERLGKLPGSFLRREGVKKNFAYFFALSRLRSLKTSVCRVQSATARSISGV